MNEYFVVYIYKQENNLLISNMSIRYNKKIKNILDVEKLESYIQIEKDIDGVKIISWKKFRKRMFNFRN